MDQNGDRDGRLKSPATISSIALIGEHFHIVGGKEFFGRPERPGEQTYVSLAASPGNPDSHST